MEKIPQLEYLQSSYDLYIQLIQKSSLVKASDESVKMAVVLEKIKSSPRFTRNNPLMNLRSNDEEIGFTIE